MSNPITSQPTRSVQGQENPDNPGTRRTRESFCRRHCNPCYGCFNRCLKFIRDISCNCRKTEGIYPRSRTYYTKENDVNLGRSNGDSWWEPIQLGSGDETSSHQLDSEGHHDSEMYGLEGDPTSGQDGDRPFPATLYNQYNSAGHHDSGGHDGLERCPVSSSERDNNKGDCGILLLPGEEDGKLSQRNSDGNCSVPATMYHQHNSVGQDGLEQCPVSGSEGGNNKGDCGNLLLPGEDHPSESNHGPRGHHHSGSNHGSGGNHHSESNHGSGGYHYSGSNHGSGGHHHSGSNHGSVVHHVSEAHHGSGSHSSAGGHHYSGSHQDSSGGGGYGGDSGGYSGGDSGGGYSGGDSGGGYGGGDSGGGDYGDCD